MGAKTSTSKKSATGKVHTFLTHRLPHLDEIFVYWMLLKFWADKCRKSVKMRFWDPKGADDGTTLTEVSEDKGILICGIGGGELDEHPTTTTEGKDGECAATLAAKKFGVFDMPELKLLLAYITANDLSAQGTRCDLASGLRAMLGSNPDPMVAIKWAMQAFDAFYAEQLDFSASLQEFRTRATVEEIFVAEGKRVKMATIETDNQSAIRCARYLGIAVLIQRGKSGTQIFTDKRAGLPLMEDVARILRVTEQEAKGNMVTTNWTELARDGCVAGAEEWCFFRKGNTLLNGSLTTPNTPTRLSLVQIQWAVRVGLNQGLFEQRRFRDCLDGICSSTRNNPCPWFRFGLGRCQKVRLDATRR